MHWRDRMHNNFMGLDHIRRVETDETDDQISEMSSGEFPLPAQALEGVPQDVLADIFHAQRKLLAELQRLRDENEQLHIRNAR